MIRRSDPVCCPFSYVTVIENSSRSYFEENYPDFHYKGFVGFIQNDTSGNVTVGPQVDNPFYFPIHYVEPLQGNEAAIDLDLYSSPTQRKTIQSAILDWKPSLTDRLRLVQDKDPAAYSIILHHPGVRVSTQDDVRPNSIALMVIRIPALIERAAKISSEQSKTVYIYDRTYPDIDQIYLGAATISATNDIVELEFLPEKELSEVLDPELPHIRTETVEVEISNRLWTVVVQSTNDTYDTDNTDIIIGATIIITASLILAVWFCTHMGRLKSMNEIKRQAETDKAGIVVETARRQALAERQLNEYIAHEVRNPLASAIAALSFASSAIQSPEEINTDGWKSVRDDMKIIDTSLHFINELLRNMLDMNRAAMRHMKIHLQLTDLRSDVLDPVAAILFMRGSNVIVEVVCPDDLVVMTDKLRLKQIVLNLATNSSKFVENGYVRLRGGVVDGLVQVAVEDSGPGIPEEKRGKLFVKFQDSLDLLNQGTGIGLCLCKHLVDLLEGDIQLDVNYRSEIEGCIGTRFVIDLRAPTIESHFEQDHDNGQVPTPDGIQSESTKSTIDNTPNINTIEDPDCPKTGSITELPENLNVLFADDDMILRKLFSRSLKKVAPTWSIQEAANGETAIQLVDSQEFDIIFLDQYMTAINKQLLGSETARALRAKGIGATICGLSANDMEETFVKAGADCFMFKPFPCEANALKDELIRICNSGGMSTLKATGQSSSVVEGRVDKKEQ
jgi:signal transduction histidine kinase/CheY-like chemotaxis protein